MIEPIVHETFSPTILEFQVPDKFVDMVNLVGDAVLGDDKLSKQWDFSDNLVGKVSKEVKIPMASKEDGSYLKSVLKSGCLKYMEQMHEKNRDYGWRKIHGNKTCTLDDIFLAQSWIVSQYKGEYNPWHKHSGHLSGVIYLKIPEDMDKHFEKEMEDHYPVSGMIQFTYGESANLRSDTITFKPEVGQFLIFPSWLKHSVYPFYCDGERRSMSFNVYYKPVG